jgi:outer membrane lipoprotein
MKKLFFVALAFLVLSSCTTVLRKDLLCTGERHFTLEELTRNPDAYKGRLFILGGTIADTTVTNAGSLVKALYVPVDSYGYLKDKKPDGRFLVIYPKERGVLDPVLYREHKKITVAAVFTGTEQGRIGQMEYVYPVFRVEEIYLWPKVIYYADYCWGPYWGPYWGPPYWGPPPCRGPYAQW